MDVNAALFLSLGLTVLSNIGYHFSQKGIASNANPLLSLAATYLIALAATAVALVAWPLARGEPLAETWSAEAWGRLNWASYSLGIAAVGLELGFLWAYRSGWKISVAALCSNALVTLALIPIGIMHFHEGLSLRRSVGIVLALAGLWALSGA